VQIDTLNIELNRKLFMFAEQALFVKSADLNPNIAQMSYEQRVARLAHVIVASRKIDSLDATLAALTEIVAKNIVNIPEKSEEHLSRAKIVVNFLHAMFLTAGQSEFANQVDLFSDSVRGKKRQEEICNRFSTLDKKRICYRIMAGSALQDNPKMVIGSIAQKVEDSVYRKFILVYPAMQVLRSYPQ
jgi:hypothetical protein